MLNVKQVLDKVGGIEHAVVDTFAAIHGHRARCIASERDATFTGVVEGRRNPISDGDLRDLREGSAVQN